jgi:carboxypeptidase D
MLRVAVVLALAALSVLAGRDLVIISGASRDEITAIERLGIVVNGPRPDGWEVEATTEQQVELANRGYGIKVRTPRIDLVYQDNSLTFSDDAWYMTYEHYRDTLITIAQNNSSFTKLETLGYTSSNRLLLALKFSNNPLVHENRPAVHFEANIHGDEKIGWGVLMELVKELAAGYGSDTLITRLINTREIWLVPLVNPDGYVRARRYNDRNVDLNRNWGWMWGNEYNQGSAPLSEPEAQAMLGHILRHPFVIYVSYHAGTEFISHPWSYDSSSVNPMPEFDLIQFLSARYDSYNGYTYGPGADSMYIINGSTKDFNYGLDGSMGWSIEVHYTKTPSASEIIPTYNRNRGAILEFFHRAGHGIHGRVTNSVTGGPVRAQVWVNPANWHCYSDSSLGDFHRFHLPGTYDLTVRAPGYREKTLAGVVVPNSTDSAVTVAVELVPDSTAPLFGFRVMYSFYITSLSANRTYPTRALGPRDGVCYQLDANKYICIDMGRPVRDADGSDLVVYRPFGTGTATVKTSLGWAGPWTTLGTANSEESAFDLAAAGLDSIRYVRIEAASTFQLDAVEGANYTGIAGEPRAPAPHATLAPTVIRGVLHLPPAAGNPQSAGVLFDASGRAVLELRPGPNDVSRLAPGVYFARVAAPGGAATRVVLAR